MQGAVPPLEEVKSGSAGPNCPSCLSCSSWGHRWRCPGARELHSLLSFKIFWCYFFFNMGHVTESETESYTETESETELETESRQNQNGLFDTS